MIKIFIPILLVALSLSLCGCGQSKNSVVIEVMEVTKYDSKEKDKILNSDDCTIKSGSEWSAIIKKLSDQLKDKQAIRASINYSFGNKSGGSSGKGAMAYFGVVSMGGSFGVVDNKNNLLTSFPSIEEAKSFVGTEIEKTVSLSVEGLRSEKTKNNYEWGK